MLAIIGGTGLYQLQGAEIMDVTSVDTPYGPPSAPITRVRLHGEDILFLPRHGTTHQLLPHEINYRANIYALKSLGCRQVLCFSAVGSLKESLRPGDFVVPNQYFDFVKSPREKTFFGNGLVGHISTATPVCDNLSNWIHDSAQAIELPCYTQCTYACVDGPRLGTKAESHFLIQAGCDVVGMTGIPEVFLAREAQLCYATICIVTDYDCWMDDPEFHVTVAKVIQRYGQSLSHAQNLLTTLLQTGLPDIDESYRCALTDAILTPEDALPESKKALLDLLRA